MFLSQELAELSGESIGGLGGWAGMLVASGTSFLIGPMYAIPIFIGTHLVTAAQFDHRTISTEEYEFANVVFGGTLPPRKHIVLTNLFGLGGRAFVTPSADQTSVLVNLGDAVYNAPGGPMRATTGSYPVPGQVLIHELTHAWQFARHSFVPGYVCCGAFSSDYGPPPAGSSWSGDFGLEQEASTVDQWFSRYARTAATATTPSTSAT